MRWLHLLYLLCNDGLKQKNKKQKKTCQLQFNPVRQRCQTFSPQEVNQPTGWIFWTVKILWQTLPMICCTTLQGSVLMALLGLSDILMTLHLILDCRKYLKMLFTNQPRCLHKGYLSFFFTGLAESRPKLVCMQLMVHPLAWRFMTYCECSGCYSKKWMLHSFPYVITQ